MPCILTGIQESEGMTVDPMHIGTAGRGMKSPDNEVLPVLHKFHRQAHAEGEMDMLRRLAPNWLLREAFRAYARDFYEKEWKGE